MAEDSHRGYDGGRVDNFDVCRADRAGQARGRGLIGNGIECGPRRRVGKGSWMPDHRRKSGTSRHAFQPSLDGRLESRKLMAAAITSRVAYGGQLSLIKDTDGERYGVLITGGGVVHAKPMSGGRVELIVLGSTDLSVLSINPYVPPRVKGLAHTFPVKYAHQDGLLHIGSILIESGKISEIDGYHTADLSGPINISGNGVVNRIAFQSLKPGAMIATSPDTTLNTLDVLNNIDLSGGPGIALGRDLNSFSVGGNLTLSGGSSIVVGRDLGLMPQAAQGTGPGTQGALVQGNVVINDGSTLTIQRTLQGIFLVNGTFTGSNNVQISFGGNNLVARGGFTS